MKKRQIIHSLFDFAEGSAEVEVTFASTGNVTVGRATNYNVERDEFTVCVEYDDGTQTHFIASEDVLELEVL